MMKKAKFILAIVVIISLLSMVVMADSEYIKFENSEMAYTGSPLTINVVAPTAFDSPYTTLAIKFDNTKWKLSGFPSEAGVSGDTLTAMFEKGKTCAANDTILSFTATAIEGADVIGSTFELVEGTIICQDWENTYFTSTEKYGELKVVAPTPVVEDHTVTFDVDGATSTAKVADKAAATKPADPTKDGYTFKHWSLVKDGADAYDFTTPVTGDITLYAVFEKNAPIPPKDIEIATGTTGYADDFVVEGVTYKNLWVGEYTLKPDGKAFKINSLTISGNKNGAAAPDKNIPSGIDTTFEGNAELTFKVALIGVDDPGSMAVAINAAYID